MKNDTQNAALQAAADKINAFAKRFVKDETLLASASAYVDGETDDLMIDIERYRENGRALKIEGRLELAKEDHAEQDMLKFAASLGFTFENIGYGSGQFGPINCYKLTPKI